MKTKYPGVYLDEENKTYYCSFYFVNGKGKKVRKFKRGFSSIEEAMMYKLGYSESNNKNILFDKVVSEFLINVKQNTKISTYHSYRKVINLHILPYFKGAYINNIGPVQVKYWKEEKLKEGYSAEYLKKFYRLFNLIFVYAIKHYDLPKNPVAIEGPFKVSNSKKRMKHIITMDEFKQFLSVIDNKMDYLMFNLLYFCGMRKGELIALRWCDIDFGNKVINISHNYCKFSLQLADPKNKLGARTIVLSNYLVSLLKDYYDNCKDRSSTSFIFRCKKAKTPISRTEINRRVKHYCELAGVYNFNIKDFRDTHDTINVKYVKNMDQLNSLALRSGHTKKVMLDIYVKAKVETQSEFVDDVAKDFLSIK